MSIDITMDERYRVFDVFVGCKQVGRVTCNTEVEDGPEAESYFGETRLEDGTFVDGTRYTTLKKAGLGCIEYKYDVTKIDKVTKRKA